MADVGQIYGQVIACECGKTHHIDPAVVALENGSFRTLPRIVAESSPNKSVTVVADIRTWAAAGDTVYSSLEKNTNLSQVIVPDRPDGRSPVCDEVTRDWLANTVGAFDLLVAVGSGVVNDLCKWVSCRCDKPYICVPTAASMNGYSSANVAARVNDLKTLVHARPPIAIIGEPQVILDAPHEMTTAGLGDALAKSVSSADWRLNNLLFGDYYCDRSVSLIGKIEPLYFDNPEGLLAHEPKALAALFHALCLTGVAMTMAETSAPASGGEHLISHTIDMKAHKSGASHDLHGRQVGIGTILTSVLYEQVLACENPTLKISAGSVEKDFWGNLAPIVSPEFSNKKNRLAQAAESIGGGNTWDSMRESLAPMVRSPKAIRNCLQKARAACLAEDIGMSKSGMVDVLLHAREMRSRFTILDLAYLVGILPGKADEIVDHWV